MSHQFDKSGQILPPTPEELTQADEDADIIVLDTGTLDDGAPYWAYIAIRPSKYKTFIAMATQHQPMLFEDYGTILKHGFTADIPLEAQEAMKQEYNFDEQYISKLGKRLVDVQTTFLKQKEAQRIGDIVAMMKNKQGDKK